MFIAETWTGLSDDSVERWMEESSMIRVRAGGPAR